MKLKLLLSFFLLSTALVMKAQTADEIVTKHIDAIGGADAWKKVNSMKQEGTMQVQGADVAVTMVVLNSKGNRQDITFMGMNGYRIITPTAGWNFMPFQGQTQVDAITEEELKEAQDDLDAQGKLVDYKTKGTTVEYIGKDDVDGTECYKLVVTTKSGVKETVYLDPKSYYIIKSVVVQKANGQEMDQSTSERSRAVRLSSR